MSRGVSIEEIPRWRYIPGPVKGLEVMPGRRDIVDVLIESYRQHGYHHITITMRRVIIRYNPRLKERARELRNRSTEAERVLWRHLKRKQVRGYDFHRQRPVGNYIVDFYCCELFLAIEVDGEIHRGRFDEDMVRQESLELHGISLLRFTNAEVIDDVDNVIDTIATWIDDHEGEVRDCLIDS